MRRVSFEIKIMFFFFLILLQIYFFCLFKRVQIRRGDKLIKEAKWHSLNEYMKHVDEYYDIYELANPYKKIDRVVFLASDDIEVFEEATVK